MTSLYPKDVRGEFDLLSARPSVLNSCAAAQGKLSPGLAFSRLYGKSVRNIGCVISSPLYDAYIMYKTTGEVCTGKTSEMLSPTQTFTFDPDCPSFAFEYNGYGETGGGLVLFAGGNLATFGRYGADTAPAIPFLSCGTVCRGRLFGAAGNDPYALFWSGSDGYNDGDSDANGAGLLTFGFAGGKILDVASVGEEVIVFRERRIERIKAAGLGDDFALGRGIDIDGYVAKTAKVIGGSVLFMCANGLFRYRGGEVEKVEGYVGENAYDCTSSFVYRGRYYLLAGKSAADGGSKALCVYDAELGAGYSCLCDAQAFAEDANGLIAFSDYAAYRAGTGAFTAKYAGLDFGSRRRKNIIAADVECDGDLTCEADNGCGSRRFVWNSGVHAVRMRGTRFGFKLSGKGEVRRFRLIWEERG